MHQTFVARNTDARRQAVLWDLEDHVLELSNRNRKSSHGPGSNGTNSNDSNDSNEGNNGGNGSNRGETKSHYGVHSRKRSSTAPSGEVLANASSFTAPVRKGIVLRAKEKVRQRRLKPMGISISNSRTSTVRSKMGRKSTYTMYRVTVKSVMAMDGVGSGGVKEYMVTWDVERRYSDFVRLRGILTTTLAKNNAGSLSKLPVKRMRKLRSSVVKERTKGLSLFMEECLRHPKLQRNKLFVAFLSTDSERVRCKQVPST